MGKYRKASKLETFTVERRRRRSWKGVVTALSCLVVAGTVGALTLPAITMTKPACQLEEHQHGSECFGQTSALTCNAESLNIHQHTEECFDDEGNVLCHYADFVIHEHDSLCYDAEGNLACTLSEIEEHKHDETCYTAGEAKITDPGHKHSDECYQWNQGETLICTQEETDGHVHTDECKDENGELICEQEESEGHQHTAECYERVKGDLLCEEQEREPATEPGEPVLTCEKPEVEAHTHKWGTPDVGCYMDMGSRKWSCTQLEVNVHQHTAECFTSEEVLTCPKTEHTHDESCTQPAELSEEEQQQVADVISTIDGLPPVAEIEAEFENLAEDAAALAEYRDKILAAVQTAFDEYNALTDAQKEAVTNRENLSQYAYLLPEAPTEPTEPVQPDAITPSVELLKGELPEDAQFRLAPIPADSEAYAEAVRKANAYLSERDLSVEECVLLDMGYEDAEGASVALDGKAKVTLSFETPILPGITEVMALHITDDGAEDVLADAVWDENGITSLTLITDGFSPFLVPKARAIGAGVEERLSGDNAYIKNAQMKMDEQLNRQAIATGTAEWDDDDKPGNDSTDKNDILRTFDVATYTASFETDLRPDAGVSGYRTGTVYFEFILNEPADRAQFEPGSMGWLATYEEVKYETVVEGNHQILRGSFLMTPTEGNESTIGNSYSELTVAVRALRMKQGDTLQPTFTIWLEGNDVDAGVVDGIPTKVVTGSDHTCGTHNEKEFHTITPKAITISAAYRLNVELWSATASNTSYVDEFDFNTAIQPAIIWRWTMASPRSVAALYASAWCSNCGARTRPAA